MGFFSVSSAGLLITGLRSVDGSIADPFRNAVNIIMIFIFSYFFFKEKVRPIEPVGTGTALVGLVIVTSI
jgi:multidrug transporter EmrE-like cation transporter